jgi:uncharacterized protein YvpB
LQSIGIEVRRAPELIDAFGGAPTATSYSYWKGWDIARAIVMLPGSDEGYVLDGWGGIHPVNGAPAVSGNPYWYGQDIARGLDLHFAVNGAPDGGATLDDTGVLHTWGNYPYTLQTPPAYPGRDVFVALHDVDGHVYALGRFGTVVEYTSGTPMQPDWTGYVDHGNADVLRDVVLDSAAGGSSVGPPMSTMAQYAWNGVTGPRGGVWLDGWGVLHEFGGLQLNSTGLAYWPGWDIARGVAVMPDGQGGWTLDGWGGIHPFGDAPHPAVGQYWRGWDIARAIVMNPDGRSGYVLDGWGGIHPVGGAPALNGYAYWKDFDVARGLAIHYNNNGTPDGGWTLDAYGGMHPFGAAPAVPQPQYWRYRDIYQQLNSTYDGELYTVSVFGIEGGLTTSPDHPFWSGYTDEGGWNIIRDTVLFGTDSDSSTGQPMSTGAYDAYWDNVWVYDFNIPPVQQGLPLDCESAALEEATLAKGHDVSQYTIFNDLPQHPGSATWSNGTITQWGDAYTGFVGNVYGSISRGTGYGVYDPAIVQVADELGFNAIGIEGGSPQQLYTYLAMGDPVQIVTSDTWEPVPTYFWQAPDGRSIPYNLSDHSVTLVAENGVAGTVTLDDVEYGIDRTFSMAQFAAFWTTYLDMAIVLT